MYTLSEIVTTLALATLGYMTAWFVLAVMLKRRDVVDSAWGLGFIVAGFATYSLRNSDSIFTHIALALVSLWGMRLFVHLTIRNWNKKEDYRYQQMGTLESFGDWIKVYFTVFILQGVLMLTISIPIIAIMYSQHDVLTGLAITGSLVWLFGILFEAIADYQLQHFIHSKKKGIMQSGLWRYSRHPNYFGEITVWWGASIVAIAFGQWWGVIGALVITILITKISGIPLLEKRYADSLEYQKYAKRTSILIPLPVKHGR